MLPASTRVRLAPIRLAPLRHTPVPSAAVRAPAPPPAARHRIGRLLAALFPGRGRVARHNSPSAGTGQPAGASGPAGSTRQRSRHVAVFGPVVSALGRSLEQHRIATVVEFGCGDGRWLAWLRDQWSCVSHYHGVDRSAGQIAANRSRHPDLAFDAADPLSWAEARARPRSLFMTQCGVLADLPEAALDRLLRTLVRRAPDSMVCFIEPVADDLDLAAAGRRSMPLDRPTPHGPAVTWSHHYPARLRAAGLALSDLQIHRLGSGRMLVLIGRTPPAPGH